MKKYTYFLAAFLWILLINVSCNKEQAGTLQQADIAALRGWLHENGGSFKNETIMVQATGKPVYGKLDWDASRQYRWQGNTYIDVPFVFEKGNRYLTAPQAPPTTFNLVVRKTGNSQFEGAIRTTTYTRGKVENLTRGRMEKGLVVQSYQLLNGQDANLWMGQEGEGQPRVGKRLQLSATEIAALRAGAKNKGNDSAAGTLSRTVLLQQVCDVMVYTSYRTACWYETASDEAAMHATCMSVPVLFSVEYCYNTPIDGTRGFPPDPVGPGGGGGVPLPEPPTPWDCDCYCDEVYTEMMDANLAFEPKWGQLGNKDDILNEVIFAKKNLSSDISLQELLNVQKNYFEANRMWGRNSNGDLFEMDNSKAINRYIYTLDAGWIDMHHFFYAASLAEKYNIQSARQLTSWAEGLQWLLDNESAFSYEDLPSNMAGIIFWNQYKTDIKSGKTSLELALDRFLTSAKAIEPSSAPNYDFIPHAVNGQYPKNFKAKGLVGEYLKQKAKEAFCSKSKESQNAIIEAHKKLPASSPRKY